MAIDTFTFK